MLFSVLGSNLGLEKRSTTDLHPKPHIHTFLCCIYINVKPHKTFHHPRRYYSLVCEHPSFKDFIQSPCHCWEVLGISVVGAELKEVMFLDCATGRNFGTLDPSLSLCFSATVGYTPAPSPSPLQKVLLPHRWRKTNDHRWEPRKPGAERNSSPSWWAEFPLTPRMIQCSWSFDSQKGFTWYSFQINPYTANSSVLSFHYCPF